MHWPNVQSTVDWSLKTMNIPLVGRSKEETPLAFYTLYYEQDGNITKTSNNIGISRQWLSRLKNLFEKKDRDPRKLEPESKAPHSTKNRERISKEVEGKILKARKDSKNVWGKVKVAVVLGRDYGIKIDPNTVKVTFINTNWLTQRFLWKIARHGKLRLHERIQRWILWCATDHREQSKI